MRRSSQGGGYRGRGPMWPVLLVLVLLLLAGAAVWFFLFRPPAPAPMPPTTPAPAATPAPTATAVPSPTLAPAPAEVRGVYISGPVAGDPYLETLLTLLDETELNAAVVDVKNDEGNLTYRPDSGAAVELGAYVPYIRDLPALVAELKDRGIYTIARIAAFKDPVLAQARPELALRLPDGTTVTENGGPGWVNPYEQDVWAYLIEVALGAAEAGFDEVQFDYVRFPTGKGARDAVYGPASEGLGREDAVVGFLAAVRDALHARGVRVSADVFGTVISSKTDAALIGQDYARMAEVVDVLCPMVYPSHYAAGSFGLEVPDREPYQTVLKAMEKSQSALPGADTPALATVRPWLQDFTATWVPGHLSYGAGELRAQIQAVYDAGYTDWLLWNAKNSYSSDGLLPPEGDG